jgi:branched-chain amino acid transport system substrate-binding protein
MLGVDGWSSVLDVVTDPSLIEGAYYCSGYSRPTLRAGRRLLADYAAKYNGEVPNMFAAQGYDAAWILCNAIAKPRRTASSTAPTITSRHHRRHGGHGRRFRHRSREL